jgi:hypothetical protein
MRDFIIWKNPVFFTYDHRTLNITLPVRSALYKQCTGGLVVRWVTTSESPLLYVFALFGLEWHATYSSPQALGAFLLLSYIRHMIWFPENLEYP